MCIGKGDSISQRSASPQNLDPEPFPRATAPEPRRRPRPLPRNHLFAVCGSPGSASSGARDAIRRPLPRQGPPLPPTRPSPAVSARSRPSRVRPYRCAPVHAGSAAQAVSPREEGVADCLTRRRKVPGHRDAAGGNSAMVLGSSLPPLHTRRRNTRDLPSPHQNSRTE